MSLYSPQKVIRYRFKRDAQHDLVERIRSVRRRWGLSQVELAGLLGVHPMTVSKWERRKALPKADSQLVIERIENEELICWRWPNGEVQLLTAQEISELMDETLGRLGEKIDDRTVKKIYQGKLILWRFPSGIIQIIESSRFERFSSEDEED
jgi:DNA-binding transcriptional regulator YiaG